MDDEGSHILGTSCHFKLLTNIRPRQRKFIHKILFGEQTLVMPQSGDGGGRCDFDGVY
jgi:hypothetical protein